MRIQDVLLKIYKIINHLKYAIFTEFMVDLHQILPIFRVYVLWYKH